MSHLLQQDSRNRNPVRRPVGGHDTGIPDDPRSYNVVPAMMALPPNPHDVDPFNGHPRVAKPHMEELKADPNQPGIDRIIVNFAPVESYHAGEGMLEVPNRTNVALKEIPHLTGGAYVAHARNVAGLSSLRAAANSFIPTAGVRRPIYGI